MLGGKLNKSKAPKNRGYYLLIHLYKLIEFLATIFIKNTNQVLGYYLSGATFNLVSLYHIHQLAIFKQGYCWRRRRIRQ
jgi:hypothetical protein